MPVSPSPYLTLGREEWAGLGRGAPVTLTASDVAGLRGFNEEVSLPELVDVYVPLSLLVEVHVTAARDLRGAVGRFLGRPVPAVPYVVGIAGSVAVGKSTTARLLQALLARRPDHPRVDLVTTDGFLLPNAVLTERGLMRRKGFPESYDVRRLVAFMADLKAGVPEVAAPVYSHLSYDVVDGEVQVLDRPEVVIVEGVNVLQAPVTAAGAPDRFVSDYVDLSIYVDARVDDIAAWYVQRFLALRGTAFADPASYFHRFSTLSDDEAVATATDLWASINDVNRREHIEPTRGRAHVILEKGSTHAVQAVHLRPR
jgi:type I pantothenate kinase